MNGILGKIRESCGKEALSALNHRNAPCNAALILHKLFYLNILLISNFILYNLLSSVYGSVWVKGVGPEHLSDDRLLGAAVCRRPAYTGWICEPHFTTLSCRGIISCCQRGTYYFLLIFLDGFLVFYSLIGVVRGEFLFIGSNGIRVLFSHNGRPRRAGGHSSQDRGDRVL